MLMLSPRLQIFEQGLNEETHQWGSDILFLNAGYANITIPSCVQSGQYLLRAEAICELLSERDRLASLTP